MASRSSCTENARRIDSSRVRSQMIRVAVTGLGRIWRHRLPKAAAGQHQIRRTAYYNTTGVLVNGQLETRPQISGHVRFNGTSGFDPNYPSRAIHQVFECADPCIWKMQNKLLFERLVQPPTNPDLYLVVARSEQTGRLDVGYAGWRSGNTGVISFSEDGEQQETMLLMAAGSWLRSRLGILVVDPDPCAPWVARLRFHSTGS
jgi:hypothetical protein